MHWSRHVSVARKKNPRTINSPIFRLKLFNSFGIFSPTIMIIVATSAFRRSVGYQARPSHAFSILSNFPSLETADCKTIQNTSRTATWHRPFDHRNWCCVHCTCMLCIPSSAGHRPQTPHPHLKDSKQLKFIQHLPVTISYGLSVGAPFSFYFSRLAVVFVFCLCEYFRFCVIRKLPLRSIRMRFFFSPVCSICRFFSIRKL